MHVNDVVNKKKWKGNKIMDEFVFLHFLELTVGKIYTQEKFHFCQLVYLELWEW